MLSFLRNELNSINWTWRHRLKQYQPLHQHVPFPAWCFAVSRNEQNVSHYFTLLNYRYVRVLTATAPVLLFVHDSQQQQHCFCFLGAWQKRETNFTIWGSALLFIPRSWTGTTHNYTTAWAGEEEERRRDARCSVCLSLVPVSLCGPSLSMSLSRSPLLDWSWSQHVLIYQYWKSLLVF